MDNWNPDQYLKFKDERTQPSIDLVSKIKIDPPGSIIDIGCGPGNSTQVLRQRWPEAEMIGLDSSEQMIKKAGEDFPQQQWLLADAFGFEPNRTYDLVFSNAALQWIHHHEILLPRLLKMVDDRGVLAVQVPGNQDSPIHRALFSVSSRPAWRPFTKACENVLNYQSAGYYYDLLSPAVPKLELWETTYYHILNSYEELLEWYRSTGMRPFLEALPEDESRRQFEKEILEECRKGYTRQRDGKILYLFKRIFFVAYT